MHKVEVAQDGTNFEVLLTDDNGSKTLGIFETKEAAEEAAKVIEADLAWAAKAE